MNKTGLLVAALVAVASALPAVAAEESPRFLYVQNAGSMTLSDGRLTIRADNNRLLYPIA